jgi:hypothetical protein
VLRIILVDPPNGVVFAIQRGRDQLIDAKPVEGRPLCFEVPVRVRREELRCNFLGPFVQGPRTSRFIHVTSGTLAGQASSCWTRRAKVPLGPIPWQLVEKAVESPEHALEARIAGRARDGGPACATVPLLGTGWTLVTEADPAASTGALS